MPNTARTKTSQKRLDSALAAFHTRYSSSSQFGRERWEYSLREALLQPTSYVALLNSFVPRTDVDRSFREFGISAGELTEVELPNLSREPNGTLVCVERSQNVLADASGDSRKAAARLPFPPPTQIIREIGQSYLSHWNLDAASVLAAHIVNAGPGEKILDLCSAPGGKAVVLSQSLFAHVADPSRHGKLLIESPDQTCLHVNEPDTNRNKRLTSNLKAYLPTCLFESGQVKVLKLDLSVAKTALPNLPLGEGQYDKVLLDAPCSSERHILHAHVKATAAGQISEEMMNWKASHSTAMAKTQTGLLMTALRAVKVGGRVIYATCALGTEENDGAIETLLINVKKERLKARTAHVADQTWSWSIDFEMGHEGTGLDDGDRVLERMTESTKYGRIALPDKGGWGPLYFCVMNKVERKKAKSSSSTSSSKNKNKSKSKRDERGQSPPREDGPPDATHTD